MDIFFFFFYVLEKQHIYAKRFLYSFANYVGLIVYTPCLITLYNNVESPGIIMKSIFKLSERNFSLFCPPLPVAQRGVQNVLFNALITVAVTYRLSRILFHLIFFPVTVLSDTLIFLRRIESVWCLHDTNSPQISIFVECGYHSDCGFGSDSKLSSCCTV